MFNLNLKVVKMPLNQCEEKNGAYGWQQVIIWPGSEKEIFGNGFSISIILIYKQML